MTKSKKKIIFLTTSFILTICLMGFMGVYALTILKNSQINVGISYQPEYLVKVEMGIDGANSGTFNQTIEESEYVEIYNSLNPVSNGMYIQSMSRDTIRLEANSLTPDSTGLVYFRFYILDGETKDIFASVNCGETTEKTSTLKTTATQLSIQTGVTADNPALLGALKINIKFEEEILYTVHQYDSGTGPVYDDTDKSNRYVHYIEMGEYPQTYCGTTLPKEESEYKITADYYYNKQGVYQEPPIIKSTLYEDKTTGQKFAKQGTNFYNVEPVRWIVIGVTDGVYNGGQHVLFTTVNKTNGLWLYDEATNTFKYRTATSGEWEEATEVLVLSEYSLLRSTYKDTGSNTSPYYNHFSQSDINKFLNTNANSVYNTMFTDNQKAKIIPKTMPITTYYQKLNSTDYNDVYYNMFLLGSTRNYNGGYINNGTDSYNLSTYFTPANTDSSQSNLVAKATAYSLGGTQDSPDSYSAYEWWLRSGYVYNDYRAIQVHSAGNVSYNAVITSLALRPAFVLSLI